MATSDTGSSFSHWFGLHDQDPSPDPRAGFAADGNNLANALATSPTKAAGAQQHPGIEGPRVGKPAARRRSRASRRAPVTLLNTDTANFRAMVQQFTGIPTPPAGAFGAPVISFAGDCYGFPPAAGGMSSYDHVRRSQQQPLHDQLRRQQQQQQHTGAAFGYNGLLQAGVGGGDDVFVSAEDRMLLQSMHAAQTMMPPGSAANNSTSLGFFA